MERFSRKVFLILLVVALGLTVLGGCNNAQPGNKGDSNVGDDVKPSSPGKKVEITYWHTHGDEEEKVLKEDLIPKFEEENQNIKIEPIRMPYDGLKQQVIQSVSSGTAPDLMRMDIIWTPEFAKMGALESMNQFPEFLAMKDGLFEGPLSTNLYDGEYYGVPLNTNTKAGIFSKAMLDKLGLDEIPKTLEEVIALKDKLGPEEYLIGCGGPSTWGIFPYFYSLGGSFTNEDYTKASGYFNSEESINAMNTILQWYDEKILSPSILGGKPDNQNGVFDGQVLFTDEGPWFFANNKEEDLEKVEAAILPAGPAGSISVVGGENLVMFTNGKHHDESWVFVKFLMGEYAQETMALKTGLIPTVIEVAQSEKVMGAPYMDVYVNQLNDALARTPHPSWEKMSDKIGQCFESILRHESTAKEAMDKLAPELDELLAAE
jgi:multiple sugar transport system substrate-binding protein